MSIGERIRELRNHQGMKLIELAEKSDVQIATLSRIEHGKMTGTLDSHMRIAKALGLDVTRLYSNITREENKVDAKTSKTEADVFVHSDKSSYEILTSRVISKKMMPILLKIDPGGRTNKEQNQAGTEKFVFVLEGKVEVQIGGETYLLSESNSIYFDASLEHQFINKGESTAKVLCVGTPVAL